jgi:hypothetical protein
MSVRKHLYMLSGRSRRRGAHVDEVGDLDIWKLYIIPED